MHRTIEDYDSMAKREIIKAKQEKGQMCVTRVSTQLTCLYRLCRRVQKFRSDYAELKAQFELIKTEACSDLAFRMYISHAIAESCGTAQRTSRRTLKHAISFV
jgi:hypothetical protein